MQARRNKGIVVADTVDVSVERPRNKQFEGSEIAPMVIEVCEYKPPFVAVLLARQPKVPYFGSIDAMCK